MKAGENKGLAVEDLHVHYGEICALRGVTFCAQRGASIAVVGRNGAGKSTLLKSLAGLISGMSGKVTWQGEPIRTQQKRSWIAYLPQREEIDWNFPITVGGLVDMGLYPRIGPWRRFTPDHRKDSAEAIRQMGLEGLETRRIAELSGGQQQRAFMARALAGKAEVFLLDEPFAGLDPEGSRNLAERIRELARQGAIIISSHHDLDSIPETFEHTLLVKTRQIAFGPSREILSAERIREAFG